MPLEIPKIKEKTLGAKLLVGAVMALFTACIALFAWAAHTRYSYYQYLTRLEYVMGGQTSTVTTEDEEGNRCTLSETNRRAFYTFLADTSWKRVQSVSVVPTGKAISFHAVSAVGQATGKVSEIDSGYVEIEFTYEGKNWRFYCKNRSDYAHYEKTASPEGWFKPNDPYVPIG